MKITKHQLKTIIRKTILLKEYNDQDYQNEVEDIVSMFYERAREYDQYMPVSLDSLSSTQVKIVFEFRPPEFSNLDAMDSSAMLELNPVLQSEINEWLAEQDAYEGDTPLPTKKPEEDSGDLWL